MIALVAQVLPWVVWPCVLATFVLLDALYSGMETGVYVLNKVRLDLHADAGQRPARFLQQILRRPEKLLVTLLVGTNISRYMETVAISAMFVEAGHADKADLFTIAVATPVMFAIGDAVPKQAFQRLGEHAVYRLTPLLRVSQWLFTVTGLAPLVSGVTHLLLRLTGVSGGEYRHTGIQTVIAEGRASGLITSFQSAMAERVMRIAEVTLADAMRPMNQVICAPLSVSRTELLNVIRGHDHTRIPLLGGRGSVAGVLDVYEVLTDTSRREPRELMAEPFVLPAWMNVSDALYAMQRNNALMAVVEDRSGRHVGIATLKDLVEEIVGELQEW
jgi:CBS domain containing-hemolysin-like protein